MARSTTLTPPPLSLCLRRRLPEPAAHPPPPPRSLHPAHHAKEAHAVRLLAPPSHSAAAPGRGAAAAPAADEPEPPLLAACLTASEDCSLRELLLGRGAGGGSGGGFVGGGWLGNQAMGTALRALALVAAGPGARGRGGALAWAGGKLSIPVRLHCTALLLVLKCGVASPQPNPNSPASYRPLPRPQVAGRWCRVAPRRHWWPGSWPGSPGAVAWPANGSARGRRRAWGSSPGRLSRCAGGWGGEAETDEPSFPQCLIVCVAKS